MKETAPAVPVGAFDVAHAPAVARAVAHVQPDLEGCRSIDVDLTHLDRIDGAGAVLLARLLDRLDADGDRTRMAEDRNPEAARLITLYRQKREEPPPARTHAMSPFAKIGVAAAGLPPRSPPLWISQVAALRHCQGVVVSPSSVDWHSLPRLVQQIGADALPVTSAANLLVGVIIGFLGVSQLGRFGAVVYVPELVVVAHFRELGPLVTAIVVAGRSGAGSLASEIATMKVSEEIDALRSMGFDPVRWLVVSRCVALVLVVPLLTWVGDALALLGGLMATVAITDLTPRAYVLATMDAITVNHFVGGLIKTPFLALAIGLIACGQGLATQGGAAAVGARTTTAVVLAIFGVIVINSLFTLLYVVMGV